MWSRIFDHGMGELIILHYLDVPSLITKVLINNGVGRRVSEGCSVSRGPPSADLEEKGTTSRGTLEKLKKQGNEF